MTDTFKRTTVAVVGGGTAGWLTASIIAARHRSASESEAGVRVVLLESPQVKNLGVGEGTWPTMRDTLKKIGLSEATFIRECDASFKQGSKFVGWQCGGDEKYYHPFSAPQGYGSFNLAEHWLESDEDNSFADYVCSQSRIADQGLAPKTANTPEYAFQLNYGYHLDAGKFIDLLQKHAIDQLGVEHVLGHVDDVVSAANGDIASLTLDDGRTVEAELFIDCSGFAARLIGEHYQIPFVAKKDVLFNDHAVAAQVPYVSDQVAVSTCTTATAHDSGWLWDIPLPTRRGVGCVFSSRYCDEEQARAVLSNYIAADKNLSAEGVTPRLIKFEPGHRQTFWHQNCVAVGVSSGFVEPLEASALVMIEKSADWISEQLPESREAMDVLAKRFNQLTASRWDSIISFLKLHYALTERKDSDYWRDHCDPKSMPEQLGDALALWQTQVPWLYESSQKFELFSAASIQYVLYGMGFRSQTNLHARRNAQAQKTLSQRLARDARAHAEKLFVSLPQHRTLLDQIRAGKVA